MIEPDGLHLSKRWRPSFSFLASIPVSQESIEGTEQLPGRLST
jgi:hypothetical protein